MEYRTCTFQIGAQDWRAVEDNRQRWEGWAPEVGWVRWLLFICFSPDSLILVVQPFQNKNYKHGRKGRSH